MVIRKSIRCDTCNTAITLRIGVGHNPYQRHAFLCPSCMEEITVGMEVDAENAGVRVDNIENCDFGNEEGRVVNLSPHFVIPENLLYQDQSFGWVEESHRLITKLEEDGVLPDQRPVNHEGAVILDAYITLGGINNITELWRIIKRSWSLTKSRQHALAEQTLNTYNPPLFNGPHVLENVLFDFCGRLLIPKKKRLFDSAFSRIQFLSEFDPDGLTEFVNYFRQNLKEDHKSRYFEIFSEYFTEYSEYDQTLLYSKNEERVPEGCVATSAGFRRTKMFYGNAYENYTSNLTTLACLNNIFAGRQFAQFQNMDLRQYLTINKARRAESFNDREEFSIFSECLDSTLRNASHHQAIWLSNHRRIIRYRSGGVGAAREMSYSQYLERCNELMLSASALFMIELVLCQ